MANEIRANLQASRAGSLTVTAQLVDSDGVPVGAAIALTESGVIVALFVGSLPATAAGRYTVRISDAGAFVVAGCIVWDGATEVFDSVPGDAMTLTPTERAAIDAEFTASHGAGTWTTAAAGLTAQAVRDAMKLAPSVGAPSAGSVDAELDTVIATGGVGPWTTFGGGGGLTSQETRDAMKLAPTVGAPAAGSIDAGLDDVLADTSAIEPVTTANLDAAVSSRQPEASASSRAAADLAAHAATQALGGPGPWTTAAGFAAPGDAMALVPNAVDASAIATGAIDADSLAVDAINAIRDAVLSDSTAFDGAAIATVLTEVALILDYHANRLEVDFSVTPRLARLWNRAGTVVQSTQELTTEDGQPVTTSAGVQTRRGPAT